MSLFKRPFHSANMDAVVTAESYGISAERAVEYRCDSLDAQICINNAVTNVRNATLLENWAERIKADYNSRV